MVARISRRRLSRLLYQHDPLGTGCRESQDPSAYEALAESLAENLATGMPPKRALRSSLCDWFTDSPFEEPHTQPLLAILTAWQHAGGGVTEDLGDLISQRVMTLTPDKVLLRMGVKNPTPADLERLALTLGDPRLGLTNPVSDLFHGKRRYFRRLCNAAWIPTKQQQDFIHEHDTLTGLDRKTYRPRVEVRGPATPKLTTSPARWAGRTMLKLPDDTWRQSWDVQLERARRAARTLMSGGKSSSALSARFYYAKGEFITLNMEELDSSATENVEPIEISAPKHKNTTPADS